MLAATCLTTRSGVVQAELVANQGSPAMSEQADGFELEFVQERDNVGELPVTRVPLGWSVSPSCAAKVRRDHTVVLGKLWDDLCATPTSAV